MEEHQLSRLSNIFWVHCVRTAGACDGGVGRRIRGGEEGEAIEKKKKAAARGGASMAKYQWRKSSGSVVSGVAKRHGVAASAIA